MQTPETTSMATDQRSGRRIRGGPLLRPVVEVVAVAAAAALAGLLSLALATALPDVAQPLVDAPAGWTLIAALMVWCTRRTTLPLAALYGVVALVSLNAGWYLLGGGAGSVYAGFWTGIALLVGPVVGTAAGWLHRRDGRGALGGGVLAGIVLGDSAVSTTLIGNIGPTGGIAMVVVGLALVVVTTIHLRGPVPKLLVLGTTAGTAFAYAAAWGLLAAVL